MSTLEYYVENVKARLPVSLLMSVLFVMMAGWFRMKALWVVAPYLVGSTVSALTIGKIGSNVNYLLEFSAAISLGKGNTLFLRRSYCFVYVEMMLTKQPKCNNMMELSKWRRRTLRMSRSRNQTGFTFVELLIVVAIIGIISAMAVPNLLHGLQRAKISRTKADLRTIAIAIEMYRLDYGFVPFKSLIVPIDDIPELTRYFKGATVDSWGESLYYYSDGGGSHYVVASKGTDRSWDGFSGPPDWETPQNFKGFKCKEIPLDNADVLIERGCDIKYIDGGPLY